MSLLIVTLEEFIPFKKILSVAHICMLEWFMLYPFRTKALTLRRNFRNRHSNTYGRIHSWLPFIFGGKSNFWGRHLSFLDPAVLKGHCGSKLWILAQKMALLVIMAKSYPCFYQEIPSRQFQLFSPLSNCAPHCQYLPRGSGGQYPGFMIE